MSDDTLWAGALSQLLIFEETGCAHSGRHAMRLMDRLSEDGQLDAQLRGLCERAVLRLEGRLGERHACPA